MTITNSLITTARRRTFVAPKEPTEVVPVVLLQRMRSESEDPRLKGANGNVRQQVLMDLVGVKVNGVSYPDVDGTTQLPPVGTEEFKALMATGSGLYVESVFKPKQDELRAAIVNGDIPMSLEAFDAAVSSGSASGLGNKEVLKALGFVTVEEFTLGDILFGSKSFTVNLLAEGLGDAYAASFLKLRGKLNFANVALKCNMSPLLTVTKLTVNGVETPSYTADVFFIWNADGTLDETKAINGSRFAVGTTSAANAADLSRRSAAAYSQGASNAVINRSNRREEMLKRLTAEGQVTGAPVLNTDAY